MSAAGIALLGAYLLALAGAAVQDLRQLRISNLIVLATLAASIGLLLFVREPTAWWEHMFSFAIMLAAGMLLFSLGWVGGGDAKLAAAAAALFSLQELAWFAAATAIAGGVLTILLLLFRRPSRTIENAGWRGLQKGKSIPYGVAIALGAAWIAWQVVPPPQEDGLSRLRRMEIGRASSVPPPSTERGDARGQDSLETLRT